jgi:tight adherence protein B
LFVIAMCAVGIGLLLLVGTLLGIFGRENLASPTVRLAGYGGLVPSAAPSPTSTSVNVRASALDLTAKAIRTGGFEEKLAWKLGAAGLSLKPPEWALLHAGVTITAGLVGYVTFGGNVIITLVTLLLGALVPWLYLGYRASRRIAAFNAQLPDGLHLIAGGLKAGLSLAQAVDSIVRAGAEPMAGEFRRALIEARLGVDIEDALEGVASRMGSKDFEWVVMAIRIQRDVGGNLSEIMLTVSATLREREYLRRHVRALSAEGRLSAWILGLMPPLFLCYLALTNSSSLSVMFHTAAGVALLVVAAVLMAVGSFWMSRVVRVEG